jgi:DNA-binding FrmR family transcriptional regulator
MEKEVKKRVSHRLKIIEGQVRGLQKMVEDGKYCIDIITQSSAVRHSLSSFEDVILENHLLTHVKDQMRGAGVKKATTEILSVYKLAKNK